MNTWLLLAIACGSDPDAVAVARTCAAAPCGGSGATVTLWRDVRGELSLLVHNGSLSACSHPPATYWTPAGEQVLAQANRPVTDDGDAERFRRQRDAVLAGLTMDGTRHCR